MVEKPLWTLHNVWLLPHRLIKNNISPNTYRSISYVNAYIFAFFADDPNEYNNLADDMPETVQKLLTRMNEYKQHMIPAKYPKPNPSANPKYFGNAWTPGWCKKPME
jgi:hypothetical protein